LQLGDWEADRAGNMFQKGWFKIVRPGEVPRFERACRYWDLAASTPKAGADPDYTVGALVGIKDGIYWVADLVRLRGTPKMVEETVAATAKRDGITVMIRMEQEPGAAGLSLADHYARNVVPGYNFSPVRISGDKVARAGPFSAAAERGHVYVVEARWNQPFFDELEAFPEGDHDDQVDAVSGAIEALRQEAVWTARDVADALDAMRTSAHSGVDMFETPGLFDTANESLLFQ
jgi:predicted phage terminase large subunit-like protein